MKLYNYFRSSASFRVRIALNLKGLAYDYVPVHLPSGAQKKAEFAAVSAEGLVPVLELDDGQRLTQSMAIIEYLGETMAQGAARETAEEAGAEVEMGAFFSAMSIPRVGQVHVFYLARLLHDRFDPGHESLEARLFTEHDLPWDELAFTTVRETLKCFFADRRLGQFGVHDVDIT